MRFKRIVLGLIDFYISCFIALPICGFLGNFLENMHLIFIVTYTMIYLVFCLKDLVFKNASICKKMGGLEVVTIDNQKPPLYIILFRNLTMFIFPFMIIEVLVLMFSGKRIGDMIFKTKVVEVSRRLMVNSLVKRIILMALIIIMIIFFVIANSM